MLPEMHIKKWLRSLKACPWLLYWPSNWTLKSRGRTTKSVDIWKQIQKEANCGSSLQVPSYQYQTQGISLTTLDDFEDKDDFSETDNL